MKDKESASTSKGARLSVHVKPASSSAAEASQGLSIGPVSVQIEKILVPIDFSEPAEKALRYAAKFAELFGSKITLLHVIQPMVYPADFGYPATIVDTLDTAVRQESQQRLEELARGSSMEMTSLIRLGQPYYEITTAAKDLDIDLIIIATHGHTGLKHVLLGSTAERVVRHAPCPVLTLRDRERDFA